MGTLQLRDIRKSYGALEVIHGVTLDVGDGEFVALVGPSGCGKSTLLRMIAGLESVTGGDIVLDGKVVNETAPKDRDVAMVFQSYALYPHMSVRDNMAFSLQMARMKKADIAKSIDRAAGILGLEPYLDRKPRELSGGQMQRVAMGRAIVRDPAIFLFDEPLSNLDAKLRGKVRGEIQALHKRLGTTTVYVTHDQVEAMTLAHRLVVMRDGHVEQIGTPLDLYDRPETEFVAGFIGAPPMNLLPGTAAQGGFRLTDGTTLQLNKAAPDQATTLGIRAEHLALAQGGWPVTVTSVEIMGHETHIGALMGQTELTFTMTGRDFPAIGSAITIAPDLAQAHWFANGRRVEQTLTPA